MRGKNNEEIMRDSAFIGIALYTILPLICFGVFLWIVRKHCFKGAVLGGIEWKKSRLWISVD